MTGILLGIARKVRPGAVPDTLDSAGLGLATGVEGDFRGRLRPGSSGRRQVTVMALADWRQALAELGIAVPWQLRRVNLLVDGLVLPRERGVRLRIGGAALLEITGECDPCRRMEAVAPGLEAALDPDWRGGRLTRVVAEGHIRVGDPVSIEPGSIEEA